MAVSAILKACSNPTNVMKNLRNSLLFLCCALLCTSLTSCDEIKSYLPNSLSRLLGFGHSAEQAYEEYASLDTVGSEEAYDYASDETLEEDLYEEYEPETSTAFNATVIREGGYTNVRCAPSSSAAIVTKIQDGSPIAVGDLVGQWYEILDQNGNVMGYMHKSKVVW